MLAQGSAIAWKQAAVIINKVLAEISPNPDLDKAHFLQDRRDIYKLDSDIESIHMDNQYDRDTLNLSKSVTFKNLPSIQRVLAS